MTRTTEKNTAPATRESLADIARALNAATPIALAPHYYQAPSVRR